MSGMVRVGRAFSKMVVAVWPTNPSPLSVIAARRPGFSHREPGRNSTGSTAKSQVFISSLVAEIDDVPID